MLEKKAGLLAVMIALTTVSAIADTWNLGGRIRYPNGNPMPGLTVTITSDGITQTNTTNADGMYHFHGVPTNTYLITPSSASCPAFVPLEKYIDHNESQIDFAAECLPGKPVLISPPNLSTGVPLTPALSWYSAGATNFEVLFSVTSDPTVLPGHFADSTVETYQLGTLSPDTTYAWAVRATNDGGAHWAVSDTRTFTTNTLPPAPGLRFIPVRPCRVADTRPSEGFSGALGGPALVAGETRNIPVPAGTCQVPASARGYALNVTVVPSGPLGQLTVTPGGAVTGVPTTKTLSSDDGRIVADAVVVGAGSDGSIDVYASHPTDVIVDVNGYFDNQADSSAFWFYPTSPCRIADTREEGWQPGFGAPPMPGQDFRSFAMPSSTCMAGLPAAGAYSLNFTVVPGGFLDYLTAWPTTSAGLEDKPYVSTLNSYRGVVVANAAIVPAGDLGSISVFTTDPTHVIIDTNGYFAPKATAGLSFYPLTPCRAVNTEVPDGALGGQVLVGDNQRVFPIANGVTCGVPANAKAIAATFTVKPTTGFLNFLTAWPTAPTGLAGKPWVSTLNSYEGREISNTAIVPVGLFGSISTYVTENTHLVVDVTGYFAE